MPATDHQSLPRAPNSSRLLLHVGPNRFLRILPLFITLAATIALLLSPAGWGWKVMVLAVLGLSSGVVYRLDKWQCSCGMVSLLSDGTARLVTSIGQEVRARLLDNSWTSRWFSVVPLFEPNYGKHYYCVVCASENSASEYRRLLKFLHMRSPSPENDKTYGK